VSYEPSLITFTLVTNITSSIGGELQRDGIKKRVKKLLSFRGSRSPSPAPSPSSVNVTLGLPLVVSQVPHSPNSTRIPLLQLSSTGTRSQLVSSSSTLTPAPLPAASTSVSHHSGPSLDLQGLVLEHKPLSSVADMNATESNKSAKHIAAFRTALTVAEKALDGLPIWGPKAAVAGTAECLRMLQVRSNKS
jgi:hypothetical protein